MSKWAPILFDDLRDLAKIRLEEIAGTVLAELDRQDDIRLISGIPGQLLFLTNYFGSEFDPEPAIDKLFLGVESHSSLDGSLMSGLAGIGYALKLIDDQIGLFDQALFQEIFMNIRRMAKVLMLEEKFDFMHGYLGSCYFLLEEENNVENLSLFEDMAYALQRQSFPLTKGIGWITAHELWVNYPDEEYSKIQKNCNLGVAHGSPGIIVVLARLAARYPDLKVSGLINDALTCLMHEESETNHEQWGYYYRFYSGDLGKRYKGQLSWCHSDLGISMAYFNLWQITGDPDLFGRANRIAASCALKRHRETPSLCSGLCHGVAGAAHMFNRIYRFTDDDRYRAAACYWYSILFDEFLVTAEDGRIRSIDMDRKTGAGKVSIDNGLLDGLSGIGLSILSAIADEEPCWDKVLLL